MLPTATNPLIRLCRSGLVIALAIGAFPGLMAQTPAPVEIPQTNLTPIGPPSGGPAPPATGYGSFDPYARAPAATGGSIPGVTGSLGPGVTAIGPPSATNPAATPANPWGPSVFSRIFGGTSSSAASAGVSPSFNAPVYQNPPTGTFDNPNVYGAPVAPGPIYGQTTPFPSSTYPAPAPSTMFPNGIVQDGFFGGGLDSANPAYSAYRLCQGPRFRYAYVGSGTSPTSLNTNDFDSSVVFAFPNFCYSTQPLYLVPSFSLHLWDGPNSSTGADLPPSAYSAFLDTGWQSDPNQMISTELGIRLGMFTDFNTSNSKSFRVLGKALGHFKLSPYSTFKAGVYYLNRNSIKLVPAVGFLYVPDPLTRYDIFFPQPKFSKYCRTLGTRDLWWYIAGDYGGGTWTIQRESGASDSVDINDYRAVFGLEWGESNALRAGRRSAFVELAYVFSRDVKYRYDPAADLRVKDGIMFRGGIGY